METAQLIKDFASYLTGIGLRKSTISGYTGELRRFAKRIPGEIQFARPEEIIDCISEDHLVATGNARRHGAFKRFFNWMESEDRILSNPMHKIPSPKVPTALPTRIMTPGETMKVLNMLPPDPDKPLVYRDRLMLELLYTCSLRRGELSALNLSDVDLSIPCIHIKPGKTKKGRILPVGKLAVDMLTHYINALRPKTEENALFINGWGRRVQPWTITALAAETRKKAGIRTKATSHSFRKSSATHMLRNGAPLETVQDLLGHVEIAATQLYTRIYPKDIIKMHRVYHPRERHKNMRLPKLKLPEYYGHANGLFPKRRPSMYTMHERNHPFQQCSVPKLTLPVMP
jgi:integrase/recombinase XerD